ncbi:hypothetical protein R1sor_007018 [Riccia sorocarpa]|uniref:MOSC domain-containing protein n=1 Tax=Riccia sorocarpa TaxID=122646 RepID=A0ABD3HS47_9MARC
MSAFLSCNSLRVSPRSPATNTPPDEERRLSSGHKDKTIENRRDNNELATTKFILFASCLHDGCGGDGAVYLPREVMPSNSSLVGGVKPNWVMVGSTMGDREFQPEIRHAEGNTDIVEDRSMKAPGLDLLYVPLEPSYPRKKIEVTVWEWTGDAIDEGDTAAEWLCEYIGKSGFRLVRFDIEGKTRPTNPDAAPGFKHAFADNYPIHFFSEASVAELNSRLEEPLPLNRFRPNIVVKGCGPFDEDYWRRFSIGDTNFQGVALCPRCKITTINQETAEVGKQPLAILKKFRAGQFLSSDSKLRAQMYFGQNAVCEVEDGEGRILNIGDVIHVKEKAASPILVGTGN